MRDIRKDAWSDPPRGIRQRDLPPLGGTAYVNWLRREVERRIADGTISEGENEDDMIDDYGMGKERRRAWARKVKIARRASA